MLKNLKYMTITIKKLSDIVFIVYGGKVDVRCVGLTQLLSYCRDVNLELNEVEYALVDMLTTENNMAHFGINGTFMFSTKLAS